MEDNGIGGGQPAAASPNTAYYIVNGSSGSWGTVSVNLQQALESGGNIALGGTFGTGENPAHEPGARGARRLGLHLYFRYVKSKLTRVERSRVRGRVAKLRKLLAAASEADQQALYEALSERLVAIVRESEILALGIDRRVARAAVTRYMGVATDDEVPEGHRKVSRVVLRHLAEFPRTLPPHIQKRVAELKRKHVFDGFEVLHLEYEQEKIKSNRQKKIKSNRQKIREKDPILFGTIGERPSDLYFVADWVDEHCDLTLDGFLDKVREAEIPGADGAPDKLDAAFVERLKAEAAERRARLASTRPDNYRQLMAEEEAKKTERRGQEALEALNRKNEETSRKLEEATGKMEEARRRLSEKPAERPSAFKRMLKRVLGL